MINSPYKYSKEQLKHLNHLEVGRIIMISKSIIILLIFKHSKNKVHHFKTHRLLFKVSHPNPSHHYVTQIQIDS